MIIKLPIPLVFARQKSEKIERELTKTEKVKFGRLVMLALLTLAIATAVYFA